ncbi:MAG: glycosyltransferase 87 family protein [Candidatus Limnocylindrales bacterium]
MSQQEIGRPAARTASAAGRARRGRLASSLGWFGPLVLGAFLFTQLTDTGPAGLSQLVWLALFAIAIILAALILRRLTPTWVLALEVLAGALVNDWENSTADGLRDLGLYLHADSEFLAGGAIYRQVPLSLQDTSRADYPYLYPPPTLPFFGALASLPYPLVAVLWVGVSLMAMLVVLRSLGLSWRWTALALLWPPIEQGIFVGNIVVPSLVLLALAPRAGALLALGPLAKPQNAGLVLWLVRRRAWRALALGLGLLAAIVLATLPLTGLDR